MQTYRNQKFKISKLGVVVHICNLCIQEVEARGLQVWGQLWLQSEFQASLGCEILSQKTKTKTKFNQKNPQNTIIRNLK
jgi:hypothetical protein